MNILIRFLSMIFHGVGQALFGGGLIMLIYFIFFSNSDSKYLYAVFSVVCIAVSFGIYSLGEKASDRVFWRKKDKLLGVNKKANK
ncbi:conserved hypothetical protein [Enterobacterales bacterium 8AC]|nr:conserved hypothetical protein [Enterobacterales bacterium 8AC]